MSGTFATLPLEYKKEIVASSTQLVKELPKANDYQFAIEYLWNPESLKSCVEKLKNSIEFKRYTLKGLVSEILDVLCDPEIFDELSMNQIAELRIERLGVPVLIIENMDLSQAYKYKSVIDIRDVLNASYKRRKYLTLKDQSPWSDLMSLGLVSFGCITLVGFAALVRQPPRKEDAVTLVKSLRL